MGRKNQRGTFGKGYRTNDRDIFNPENYGLPKRKSALDEIEDTPTARQNKSTEETIQQRLKVSETPVAKKKITNAGEYPENAIIISIGPTNAGKTKYLNKTFNEESIYTYTKVIRNDSDEEQSKMKPKDRYIQKVNQAAQDNEMKQIVIDAPFLDSKFREIVYQIAKRTGRPVFIINHAITYEQCLKRINDKYGDEMQDPKAIKYRNECLKRLQRSYKEFLKAVPELQQELERNGIIESGYESQIVDIINIQNQRSNKDNSELVK